MDEYWSCQVKGTSFKTKKDEKKNLRNGLLRFK